MSFLVFIDTNIYLDFYRANNDASLSLLRRVDDNHDRIITTAQVEMEYKKNRQKVILESLYSIKPQTPAQLNIPSFLKESKYIKTSETLTKEWNNVAQKLLTRTEKLLESPGRYDPVYKILMRLFLAKEACHLNRGNPIRDEIHDKAYKRYLSGCPPRKASDTSIGDSINWEWIIYCAKQFNDDIIIIARDTDYGQHHKDKSFLNDWLLQEFKERVSRRRSIKLTRRLSEGFKLAGIDVPKAEEQAEDSLLTRYWDISNSIINLPADALKNFQTSFTIPADALKNLQNSFTIPADALKNLQTSFTIPADALKNFQNSFNIPTNALKNLQTSFTVPADVLKNFQNSFNIPTDALKNLLQTSFTVPADFLKGLNLKNVNDINEQNISDNIDTETHKASSKDNKPQNGNSDASAKR